MALRPKRGFGKGRSPRKFSYTYEDLASVFGLTVEAARKHAQRGNYDPEDLISILEFLNRRLQQPSDSLAALIGEVRRSVGDE